MNGDSNISPSNAGVLSLLGNLGLLGDRTNRPVTAQEVSNLQTYGTNLRDKPIPQNMQHWSQTLGAIMGPIAGNYTLNRAYQMQDAMRRARESVASPVAPAQPAQPTTGRTSYFGGVNQDDDLPFSV